MHWQHASCCRRLQSLAVRLAISRLVRLICLHSMVQLLLSRQQAKPGAADPDKLHGDALEACLTLLEDPEARVRLAVSECMRLLAELQGTAVWLKSRDAILDSIRACWVCPCPSRPQLMRPCMHVHCYDQLMRLLAELQGTAVWLKSGGAILDSIRACWVRPSPLGIDKGPLMHVLCCLLIACWQAAGRVCLASVQCAILASISRCCIPPWSSAHVQCPIGIFKAFCMWVHRLHSVESNFISFSAGLLSSPIISAL